MSVPSGTLYGTAPGPETSLTQKPESKGEVEKGGRFRRPEFLFGKLLEVRP